MFQLRDAPSLAQGMHRVVYQHPRDPDLLIKVIRRDYLDEGGVLRVGGKRTRWYKFPRRHGIYSSFIREIDEYLALKARWPEPIPCVQKVFGLAETDLGVGLVVEKLRGPDGGLAPTLRSLVLRDGFTEELKRKFEEYRDLLVRYDIITATANPSNIVRAVSGGLGDRLVLVDGLGEKDWLALHTKSSLLNRMGNLRRWRRTWERLQAYPPAAR
jgi:hypothetical protein